ncbi:SDR family NAD(P)-dependent oxidoreductase [Ruegeria sp. HKCCD4884]|uniref:SDR family NAD(P)-dependent oxidoreductase n=1 Tax=Ruegeria sp. HKCCD4884 TaxID=2683022 RepID=UPI001491C913|nr:SDR family NAD(P)-dependent oxidoreductase [Ruegeria sp. HKCCD4884]NOD92412.1 SDR family NAD(P)-dependent oxidoreductase [Ruegeria sp. HKCCD4884]
MPIETKHFDGWLNEVPNAPDAVMAITGATSGVGYWASVFAIRKNVKALLLLNRVSPRVQDAFAKLEEEKRACGSQTEIHTIACDLKDVGSVKQAAERVNALCKDLGGLNVLANNAGFGPVADTRSSAGYDIQMQVNFFSHYLLTKCVFPSFDLALKNGQEVRICQQSSGIRYQSSKLFLEEKYFAQSAAGTLGGSGVNGSMERYRQSKIACVAFALKLSQMLDVKGYDTTKIKSVCAEPGFAETNLVSNSVAGNTFFIGQLSKVVIRVMALLMKRQSAADGALPLAHACLAEDVSSGDFFMPRDENVGTPIKSLSNGRLDHGNPEHEKYGLDAASQHLCWKKSEQAFGSFFEFAQREAAI